MISHVRVLAELQAVLDLHLNVPPFHTLNSACVLLTCGCCETPWILNFVSYIFMSNYNFLLPFLH